MASAIYPSIGPLAFPVMNAYTIAQTLLDHKGQFVSVEWWRDVETRAAYRGIAAVSKRTVAVVRTGIDYARTAAFKASPTGEAGGTPAPIWNGAGEHVGGDLAPFIIRHKIKGTRYVQMFPTGNEAQRPVVRWYLNGEPVAFEAISGYLLAKELPDPTRPAPAVFTVKESDVIKIG